MRRAFVAVTLAILPLVPLTAQAEEEHDARVSAILDGLIAEQRMILTCSTLDPTLQSSLAVSWNGLV